MKAKRHPVVVLEKTKVLLENAALFVKKYGGDPTPFYRNRKDISKFLKRYRRYVQQTKKTKNA